MKTDSSLLLHSSTTLPFQRTPVKTRRFSKLAQSLISAFGQWLLGKDEPKISLYRDREGKTFYRVYDPITEQKITHLTEAEVRVWLEQRYRL